MRIGVDFTAASRERAGIGRYARELIRALAQLDTTNPYALLVPRDARPELLQFYRPNNFAIKHGALTERYFAALWHRARLPLPIETFIGACDVLYSPDFLLPPTRAKRTLVTVHDLSYVRLPDCFPEPLLNYLNRAVPRALERADLILADAQSTRQDLHGVYRVPLEKIRVLYSGVDSRFNPDVSEESRARVQALTQGKPYILSVSTIQPRKNYARLIHAFQLLISNFQLPISNLQLIIAGSKGWMYEEIFDTVKQLNLQDRVLFPDFFSDDDLPALYAGASLFAYPSLYEGFGLPVVEAMACGVPVISSNASSLPEVAGNAALYFAPRDVEGMAAAMHQALTNESLRADLRAKGILQAKKFSWDKAARELLGYLTET